MKPSTPALKTASFCSGICAPEVAWRGLPFDPKWFSEIDPFASAVEAHHFPGVPNLGDMEKITREQIEAFGPIDLCVAGTPCQSFSVAGLRGGMADPRGNLALVFLRLVDWIRPRWVVWENVPGVLSSLSGEPEGTPPDRVGVGPGERVVDEVEYDEGGDFACFAAALGQLGYGWAYRVLDAQYLGVPQRRRRVFVVGYLGDWRYPAAVLFERHSLSGNPPPSRGAGKRIAGTFAPRTHGGGGFGTDFESDGGLIPSAITMATGQAGAEINEDICPTLNCDHEQPIAASALTTRPYADNEAQDDRLVVTHSLRADGFDASEDGTGRGTPLVAVAIQEDNQNGVTVRDTAGSLRSDAPGTQPCGTLVMEPVAYRTSANSGVMEQGDRTAALTTNTDRCSNIIAFDTTQIASAANFSNPKAGDPCHPLASGAHPPAIAFEDKNEATSLRQVSSVDANGPDRLGSHENSEGVGGIGAMPELCAGEVSANDGGHSSPAVAFQTRIARNGRGQPEEISPTLQGASAGATSDMRPMVATSMAVRRLTPRECERLQGFPDDYTAIPYKGKPAADGPRYRALGNSMAVPVLRWIGERILKVEALALLLILATLPARASSFDLQVDPAPPLGTWVYIGLTTDQLTTGVDFTLTSAGKPLVPLAIIPGPSYPELAPFALSSINGASVVDITSPLPARRYLIAEIELPAGTTQLEVSGDVVGVAPGFAETVVAGAVLSVPEASWPVLLAFLAWGWAAGRGRR